MLNWYILNQDWVSYIILIILICITIICIPGLGAEKLNEKTRKEILKNGLYHFTKQGFISSINQGHNKVLLKGRRKGAYSVQFKPAVFFFVGLPKKNQIFQNDLKGNFYAIHIPPDKITEEFLDQLKMRRINKAIIFIGDYNGYGEIKNFKESEFSNKRFALVFEMLIPTAFIVIIVGIIWLILIEYINFYIMSN
ncbi:hypothetical protein [Bacillus cereus]|uniref:hypothetical protein n=1 Tax=Bacillus cereus TaxID=1396 RepID=UPI001CFE24D6